MTGLVGWSALHLLARDLKDRRQRARSTSTYNYYDKWANRAGWGSLSMATLALGTYGYSLIDGLFVSPPKYELLLTVDRDMARLILWASR